MNASLFLEYIDKYFRPVINKITEKYNGKSKEQTLLHKTMLTEEYSADLNWGATELNHSIVAADVVSMDSSLPLKSRSTISKATGSIPKIGVKFSKGEKAISDINVMIAKGTDEATIASKVFDDSVKAIKAVEARKEIMFLQALSTGAVLVTDGSEDAGNQGTGIRASFGYKDENTFHAKTKWGADGYTPQDDVQQMFDKANTDGNSILHVYLSKKYFDLFRHSEQGKLLAATYLNHVITDKNLLPVPGRNTFLEALADEYGATFHVVDSVFKVEKLNGTKESVSPWAEANIVGTPDTVVGRLVYGTLAEETNPVAGVNYQKSGSHILVSKYSKTDPLEEFTAAQALCIPVIDGADGIYVLHADSSKELSVSPTSLAFPKSGSSKTFTVHTDGDVSKLKAESNQDWLTVTLDGSEATAKATANSEAERSAVITVTDAEGQQVTLPVTQASGE